MKRLFLPIFFAICALPATGQFDSVPYPNTHEIKLWSDFSGMRTQVFNGDSILACWQDGMLNGLYQSYYHNGQLKASGTFKNNHRTGLWTMYSEDGKGKIVLEFNLFGYVSLDRARIPGKGGVWWGRGKIHYAIPESGSVFQDSVPALIRGSVTFRHGLKNGRQTEYYHNGNLRSEVSFSDGLYDGPRTMYYPDGKKSFELNYHEGTPDGQRKEYDTQGQLVSSREMEGVRGSFYLDKADVFLSSRKLLYTDTAFSLTSLFFSPDSVLPLFMVLDRAFTLGQLSAYRDNQLSEVYFPTHNRPDLSGLDREDGSALNLRGFLVKCDEVFNTQTWLVYKFPVGLQPVSSYSKSGQMKFQGGPWLYFPQLRSEIPESNYHFSFFKSFGYPFITVSTVSAIPWIMDYSEPTRIAAEQLRSCELEHDLWMLFYGLRKDGKIW